MRTKFEPGPPMDLANIRWQGVHHLIAYCLNDSCRHQALIDVSSYPGDTEVPSLQQPAPFTDLLKLTWAAAAVSAAATIC